ncbi:MAG TPA: hypothetical protein VIV58_32415, partial [Kofleriaceae bacterium]
VVSPLDLRTEPRAGDVSPRDRDRHAFFEILLGARDALYLSYVAAEPKSGQPLGPSSVVLELSDALAPYTGAGSSREGLEALTVREPLHRWGAAAESRPAPQGGPSAAGSGLGPIARERWAVRVRDALRAHLRGRGHPIPDADGVLALLRQPHLAQLRGLLGIVDGLPDPPAPPARRQLSLANLRAFLESPVQAWAQAVLDLDELPDEAAIDHSDEPFHVEKPARAVLLREVLAAYLRDPASAVAQRYDAVVAELALRGQFPVGVFGEAARTVDLRTLERWRGELGPIPAGAATRIGFGRSVSEAELRPALDLDLDGARRVRLVGQTEILIRRDDRMISVIAMVGSASNTSRHHLRGALDHVVLAAAGLAPAGHEHILLDPGARSRRVVHAPWSAEDARAFLERLVRELLDHAHGYLLPFDVLRRSLEDRPAWGNNPGNFKDPTGGLGYGPIVKPYGLELPAELAAIARRRLAPLADRMSGDVKLGGDE